MISLQRSSNNSYFFNINNSSYSKNKMRMSSKRKKWMMRTRAIWKSSNRLRNKMRQLRHNSWPISFKRSLTSVRSIFNS